ncbi:MAG: N-methyl-L-tryptophan oxidase [Phycisphaerales bacterium]|nr:N-methyl-L-tryptophan oxidase [Phycisphaerales bacterium]
MHDVVVIGAAGAMGSSAAMHLAQRGVRVVGVDAHAPGHAMGSSHGASRMIRMCYYEHPDYVPLLRRAYGLWDELVERACADEGTVFERTGGVYMGPAGCDAVEGSRRAAELHGLSHEMLTRSQLAERYPQFALGEEFIGLYEPEAGYLVPEAVIGLHVRLAREAGAELRLGADSRMMAIRLEPDRVRLVLEDRCEIVAKRCVLATGAWMGYDFAMGLRDFAARELAGTPLITPTRQALGWVRPRRPELFAPGVLPVWAIDAAHLGEGLFYGFPMLTGPHQREGLKIARHARGEAIKPDDPSRDPRPEDEATFRPCLERWMPEANGPMLSTAVCMYENSPDGHFIIDHHPDLANVVVACGFSGHGFKFASVVGEVIADLVLDGATRWPAGFLGLQRLSAAAGGRAP